MWYKKINDSEEFSSFIYELNETNEVLGCDIPKEYPCIIVCNTLYGFDGIDKIDYLIIYKSNF